MASGVDLNPLNQPEEGSLLGADWGPGAIPGTDMGKERVIYKDASKNARIQFPPKTRYQMLMSQMDQERESWRAHMAQLKQNFNPYATRWLDDGGQPNMGNRRDQYIIDNAPVLGIRTLAAGLISSVTSPSRPWLKIKPHDPNIMELEGVPEWCEAVTNAVLTMLGNSNYYDSMYSFYKEIGTFGTASQGGYEVKWDPRYPERPVMDYVNYTWGEYWIAQDSSQHVNTWMRQFKWTARQICERFVKDPYDPDSPGWENIAPATRALFRNRGDERRIDVVQVVEENKEYLPGSFVSKDRKVRSVFYEVGGNPNQLLEVSGYYENPIHVARWDLYPDDAWGHSPAMDCLGDAKSLQIQHRRKAQAIDKHLDPPLIGDANLKKTRVSMLPGDVTWLEGASANSYGLKPLYEVKPNIEAAIQDIQDMRQRIGGALYTDVFQMLKSMGDELKSGITATEIQARVQERILEMGPVLTRLNNELYSKQVDQLLAIGMRRSKLAWQYLNAGKTVPTGVEMLFPPPPKALKGEALKVDYISILAQAQKMDEINGIQKLITYVIQAAPAKPDVIDKIDFDRSIDIIADRLSVPPEVVISTEQAEKFRQARAQQAAQQQQQQAAHQTAQTGLVAAQAAKNLGSAPLGAGNALEHLLGVEPQGNA